MTSRRSTSLLAGRGIGLDITLASVQRLGGSIRLSSRHGLGFEARVDVDSVGATEEVLVRRLSPLLWGSAPTPTGG